LEICEEGEIEDCEAALAGHVKHGLSEFFVPDVAETKRLEMFEVLGELKTRQSAGLLLISWNEVDCQVLNVALFVQMLIHSINVQPISRIDLAQL
jgi:hypothetical protein